MTSNIVFNFYPWGLSVNVVKPVTPGKTIVSFYTYVWKEEKLQTGAGGDVVPGIDFDHLEARVGGFHLVFRLGRVHVGARAADREDRATYLPQQLPHVEAELRLRPSIPSCP